MAEVEGETIIDFCTLGMFIIDDIYPPPAATDQNAHLNIIGGAGTYAALGARLLSPRPLSRSISWIVDAGTDFPQELKSQLLSWQTSLQLRPRNALTTRGWNGYSNAEHREFKYLTEKKRLSPEDLSPQLVQAKSFHLICSPERCISICKDLTQLRKPYAIKPPIIVYEPVPDSCLPSNLSALYRTLDYINVLSPNHSELLSFFNEHQDSQAPVKSKRTPQSDPTTKIGPNANEDTPLFRAQIERHANALLAHGLPSIVVRCGSQGCFVASLERRRWLPTYHQDASKIVDPTGAGNAFLGGLAVGLVRCEGDLVEAARWGSVAAGFVVEQVGVPVLSGGEGGVEEERWNGQVVSERLEEVRKRTREV